MIEIIDQMNRTIRLEETPKRIVSLVPSQTELLFDLGCGNTVVGITKFCIHPASWFRTKTRVGGTKNVDFEKLEKLHPDLIIANKEENSQADIERLIELYPVYISDIFNPKDALQMILDIGILVARESQAKALVKKINSDFENLPNFGGKVLYFIWANPFMVAGDNTFIGSIINKLGLENCISDSNVRYKELTIEEIKSLNPDHIFLSSEPFPFNENHKIQLSEVCKGRISFVDGEMFSWYGSRMLKMKPYFEELSYLLPK